MILNKDIYVIDWIDFVNTTINHNWKLKGTLVKIENGLTEIYGKEYSLIIMKRLQTTFLWGY